MSSKTPEQVAEEYADGKSKAYYVDQNGSVQWYITERGRYSKEDFLAGYHAAYRELSQHIQFLESQLREANTRAMRLEAEKP